MNPIALLLFLISFNQGRSKSVTGPYLDKAGFSMIDGNGTDIAVGDGVKYAALGYNSIYKIDRKEYFVAHGYSVSDQGFSKLTVGGFKSLVQQLVINSLSSNLPILTFK